MPTLSIIVALTRNHAIGLNGDLLYHLPDDLRRFKALTTGHTIIMGRKTFESFPKGALPNRRNIVLSRTEGLTFSGAEVFPTLADALAACHTEEEVFIIGGASLYRQCLPMADKLYLTHIDDTPAEADTFFPPIDYAEWRIVAHTVHPADDRHPVAFAFTDYVRNKA